MLILEINPNYYVLLFFRPVKLIRYIDIHIVKEFHVCVHYTYDLFYFQASLAEGKVP